MRRLPTMLASAAAAALAALAVTVAAPAIGDDGAPRSADDVVTCLRTHGAEEAAAAPALKPWLHERLERGDRAVERALEACTPDGPDVRRTAAPIDEVRACLVRHGAQIDGADPAALKRWMAAHADDAEVREALKACDIGPPPGDACKPAQAKDPAAPEPRAAPSEPGAAPEAGV